MIDFVVSGLSCAARNTTVKSGSNIKPEVKPEKVENLSKLKWKLCSFWCNAATHVAPSFGIWLVGGFSDHTESQSGLSIWCEALSTLIDSLSGDSTVRWCVAMLADCDSSWEEIPILRSRRSGEWLAAESREQLWSTGKMVEWKIAHFVELGKVRRFFFSDVCFDLFVTIEPEIQPTRCGLKGSSGLRVLFWETAVYFTRDGFDQRYATNGTAQNDNRYVLVNFNHF